jgi:hypothetical protein
LLRRIDLRCEDFAALATVFVSGGRDRRRQTTHGAEIARSAGERD